MSDATMARVRLPVWVWLFAGLGVAWNMFGIVQLVDFATQTQASLMMKGMTPFAAELYYSLPVWMKLVFAIGSFGGLIGSLMLGARRRLAVPIFAVSLAGYVALFAGDYAYGVFDAIRGQMVVLLIVIAVAIALLVASLLAKRNGLLGLYDHRDSAAVSPPTALTLVYRLLWPDGGRSSLKANVQLAHSGTFGAECVKSGINNSRGDGG